MPAMKRLAPLLCLFGTALPLVLTGCQSTGGTSRAARSDHGLHGETAHFAPDPRGQATARELRMESNRDVVELLREADAAFQRASDAEARGDKDGASLEFKKMLSLLKEADLDPTTFYASRKDFADELEREVHARQARSANGRHSASPIKIPVPLPPAVLAQIERIRNDYPSSYQAALDRGQIYIPQIRAKFKAAGLPEELVYVAMIESHFHEKIDSRAGAGGMWQFMPETGRIHGLRQDGFVDARYDWEAATDAAISYFSKLREHFDGNWPLAIASYNAGEYGIERAVNAAGGKTDFFELINTEPACNMIKLETKDYYPKFLAYWIVATHASRYGFSLNTPKIEPTTIVAVRGSYALNDLEEAMGLEEGALAKLNPELVRQVTPPIGENRIQIPANATEKLALALQTVPQYGNSVRAHKVRKGDTLAGIAGKYGCSIDDLKKENKLKSTKLRVGQTLQLPRSASSIMAKGGTSREPDPMVQVARNEKAQREKASVTSTYTVRKGDTLNKIARDSGVSLDKLLADNKLTPKSLIRTGQKIKIVKGGSVAVSAEPDDELIEAAAPPIETPTITTEHTVAKGDTLSVIARKYGVSVAALEQLNGLEKGETIRIGQKLTVGSSGGAKSDTQIASAARPAAKESIITVVKGDTPAKIAAKAGVSTKQLLAWNNLNEKSVIQIGQKLKILEESAGTAASSEAESTPEPIRLAKAASKTNTPTVHTVSAGQTPTSIAKRYGVGVTELFRMNNWNKGHVIRPGDKVVVANR